MQKIYSRHKLKSSSRDTPKLCQAIRPRKQTGGRHQYRHDFSGLHVSAVPTHCNLCETRDSDGSKLTVFMKNCNCKYQKHTHICCSKKLHKSRKELSHRKTNNSQSFFKLFFRKKNNIRKRGMLHAFLVSS
jgi:hypothetical protein